MHRDNKPKGFFWLDHRTVDGKHGIIIDTYTTPGNVHDSQPYLARLERQLSRFKLNPIVVGLDAGYFTAPVCHLTEQIDIIAHKGNNFSTKPPRVKAIVTITRRLRSVRNVHV